MSRRVGLRSARRGTHIVETILAIGCVAAVLFYALNSLGSSAMGRLSMLSADGLSSQITASNHSHALPSKVVPVAITTMDSGQHPILMMLAIVIPLVALGIAGYYVWRRRREIQEAKEDEQSKRQMRKAALEYLLTKRNLTLRLIKEDFSEFATGRATVEKYMSGQLETVTPQTTVKDALKRLKRLGYRRFIVVDSNMRLAGVVSRKDLEINGGALVEDAMTSNPKVVTSDTEVLVALSLLLENRLSCLPVVNNGYLVGLISVSDLLMLFQCLMLHMSEECTGASKLRTPSRYSALSSEQSELIAQVRR